MCKFFLCTLLCTVFREVWGLKLAATLLSKIKKLFTSTVKNRYKHCLYVYKRHSLHYTFVIDPSFIVTHGIISPGLNLGSLFDIS